VDLKQIGNRVVVIEVNDNPSTESGVEDGVMREALYREIVGTILRRVEQRKRGTQP
jgi:glutathione synthase/RimK-type ligase-like ATP-grasp enzyme